MYDAIIVGARCAGSATAMLLARKGYRVLVVDRATFPSDIMSGHFIHPAGMARLQRWGLLDQVAATNCPPVARTTLDLGPFALSGSPPAADGVAAGYCPRRKYLDKILVDAAVAAGADLREGFSVQAVAVDGDRVVGIRGHGRGGAMVTDAARIVVGADGMHSRVARTVQAPIYNARPSLACWYYSYWSGVATAGAELYPRDGRLAAAMPTNDGLTIAFTALPVARFPAYRADIEGTFWRTVDETAPTLGERLRGGRREERFVGTADVPNFFRRPFGRGWALVGDAGYHKDPVTGQGITDAFRDAELLASAIDDGLSGRQPLAAALAGYEQQRNAAALPMYDFTCELAALAPPTLEMQQLFAALRGNQADTDRFLGLIAGTTRFDEFFAAANIARILARSEPEPLAA